MEGGEEGGREGGARKALEGAGLLWLTGTLRPQLLSM